MERRWRAAALSAAVAIAAPAAAFEIVASAGVDGLRGGRVAAAGVEARTGPLATWRRVELRLGAAAETDADGDLWGGAGPVLLAALASGWRLEASVMPGAYHDGGGDDLGAGSPMFRSMLGVSRVVADGWRLGVSVNHKSNAGTASDNPGVETVLVGVTGNF